MKLRSAQIDDVHQTALVECEHSKTLTWWINKIYQVHHQLLLWFISLEENRCSYGRHNRGRSDRQRIN